MAMTKQLRAKQIEIAQWQGKDGRQSYSTIALGEDGKVYRYDPKCDGWVEWPMKISNCRLEHPHRR